MSAQPGWFHVSGAAFDRHSFLRVTGAMISWLRLRPASIRRRSGAD